MSTLITPVIDSPGVRSAEFVNLTIKSTTTSTNEVYTFSSSYRHEIVNGVDYTPLGGLLGIGQQSRDLRATSVETNLTLTGLDPDNIFLVLGKNIRGSEVEIYRGFYNDDLELVTNQFYKRFTGIVTNYTITEQLDEPSNSDIFTITINCSSYKSVLENNVGGRRTNNDDWTYWYGTTDVSMANVAKLNGSYFDFGLKK
jgi:hypothetical protein